MTKHLVLSLLALTGLLALQPLTRAAEVKDPTTAPAGNRAAALRDRMQQTAKELNLTADQKEKLQAIIRSQGEKLRDLRQDTSLSPEEKKTKFKAIRDSLTAEVKKVLTPEQFEKWQARQDSTDPSPLRPMAKVQEAIKDLNLTDTQKEQLKPIYEAQMEKLRDLYTDNSLSLAEKLEKLRGMHKDAAPQLKKVMTPEQYEKWQKDVDQWLDAIKQRFQQGK